MDLLEEYNRKYIITKERVLQEVDEWLLYVFYLENDDLQLRTTYTSPIRDKEDYDSTPSFSIFERSRGNDICEFKWKDSAKNIHGNIFDLLCRMFSIDEKQVLEKINYDFCILDESSEVKVNRIVQRPVKKSDSKIRIKSKQFTKEGLEFWSKYGITEELLSWKQVKEVEYTWFSDSQEAPFSIRELMFAYPEYNYETLRWHYQLYCPYSKEFKFRNDLYENQIYGWNHIKQLSDTLVITKSNKDIICLKKFGIEAVSPRSETTRIKDKTVKLLQSKYKNVYTLFDNDEAGEKAALDYDLPSLFIPKESGCKDFSDFLKMYGERDSEQLLKELGICGKI